MELSVFSIMCTMQNKRMRDMMDTVVEETGDRQKNTASLPSRPQKELADRMRTKRRWSTICEKTIAVIGLSVDTKIY